MLSYLFLATFVPAVVKPAMALVMSAGFPLINNYYRMKRQKFSIRKRIRSFRYAFNGLRILFCEEHNARVHLFAAVCVLVAGVILKISALEWMAVAFAVGLVLSLEAINSSIESLADFVSPEKHNRIGKIKDLSAAGVLVAAIVAAMVGLIVFIPKIICLF